MSKAVNLKDNEYGLLKVIERDTLIKTRVRWICECKCGNKKSIAAKHLTNGDTNSCGCLQKRKGKDNPNYTGCGDVSGHHIAMIKQNAKKRNLDFSLTNKYLWDLYQNQNGKCALSGLDISLADSSSKVQTASLDRIDSSLGYIEGNVQWLHKDVNLMKWDLTQDRLLELCKLVSENKNVRTCCNSSSC